MHRSNSRWSSPEPLEARIAPALVVGNPLPNLVPGIGKTGAVVDLSHLTAPASPSAYHTEVQFTTNYDTNPNLAGIQPGVITFELLDDAAPLTVQNFLSYVQNNTAQGDYLGTFFHRAEDGFILQGGGFEAAAPSQHIAVAPPVHNEPDPVNRSNVEGTVALAKVAGDPNSGTSEFFINLGDNSANLDTQNGGFTVFAKVIQGLDIAHDIAKLPLYNKGGDGTGTPVQNYNPDPDHNPATPPPAPTPSQLITITGVKIIPPAPVADPGVTYTVHAYKTGTTIPSEVVTASVSGSKLNLKYVPGKSGIADIVVTASDGSSTVTDTFMDDVRPNIIDAIDSDTLLSQIVPGDVSTVKLHLTNNGAATASGTGDVQLFLVQQQKVASGASGFTLQPVSPEVKIPVGALTGVALNIASGQTLPLSVTAKIPTTLGAADANIYRLEADFVPKTGTALTDRFADDNVTHNGGYHELRNAFGTVSSPDGFGVRSNVVLKVAATDTLGHSTVASWSLTGPGQGTLSTDSSGGLQLAATGTTLASTLTAAATAGSAHVALDGVQLQSPVGTVQLGTFDLKGYFAASGGLKTLTLGDLSGQGLMLLGAVAPDNSTKSTITLGKVHDFSLQSDMPIASLTATEWLDSAGTAKDSISAPMLGTLRITGGTTSRGDFDANVTLDDSGVTSAVTVAGLVQDATIESNGSFGAVTVGGMQHSNLFAGVTQRPASESDFSGTQSIGSFTVAGIKAYNGALFSDTQVAAPALGTVKVMGVDGASGSGDFGFVAESIQSYTRTGGPTASAVKTPKVIDRLGNYVAEVI